MRNRVLISALLAASVGLGVAGAQTSTTTQTQTTAPADFRDVPAGHWARDAVTLITQRGLIQGFPDGTFRGNESLTRYQAALIFFRLLQSGGLSNMSQADMTTVTRGMQEVATELAAIATRVTDLERASTDQQARLAAIEQRIATLPANNTAGSAALEARIAALETAIRNIPAGPQGPAGPAGPAGAAANNAALEARVAALEAQARGNTGGTTGGTTTTTPGAGVAVNPGQGTVVVTGTGSGAGRVVTQTPTTYAAISAQYAFGSTFSFSSLRYSGSLGTNRLFGNLGGRLNFDYQPNIGAFGADVNLTYHLAQGILEPYIGVGAGATFSGTNQAGTAGSFTDYYVNGLGGFDFRFTDSLAVFAEANPRYYLTNSGTGTNLASTATSGFGIGVRAGLKFFF